MGPMEAIERITRPATLACRSCGDEPAPVWTVDAHHTFQSPAAPEETASLPSAALRELLHFSNGLTLFDASHLPGQTLFQNGLRIFGADEIAPRRRELRALLEEAKEDDPDEWEELRDRSPFDLEAWYDGFLPVAAPEMSGDLLVLDTARAPAGGEPRVLFLDHEAFYAGAFDEAMIE